MTVISDIHSLLLELMCNVANKYLSKKSSGLGISDQNDREERCYFVDAAIAFCKLQHLNPDVPIKTQVRLTTYSWDFGVFTLFSLFLPLPLIHSYYIQTELIVAMHDMLAEFGLCCAHGSDDEEEGTFLKFAIKHLLALDMKLKSIHTVNSADNHAKGSEQTSHTEGSGEKTKLIDLNAEVDQTDRDETHGREKDDVEMSVSEGISTYEDLNKEKTGVESDKDVGGLPNGKSHEKEKQNNQSTEHGDEIMEDEKEELELGIDNSLDQCFYCLYGLNLRSDSSYEDDLAVHKNTSRGDYQTKEQCADVFQYILPYAKASTVSRNIPLSPSLFHPFAFLVCFISHIHFMLLITCICPSANWAY